MVWISSPTSSVLRIFGGTEQGMKTMKGLFWIPTQWACEGKQEPPNRPDFCGFAGTPERNLLSLNNQLFLTFLW